MARATMILNVRTRRDCGAAAVAALVLTSGWNATAQINPKPESNSEAVHAAIAADDPPLVDPAYDKPGTFGRLGPPGPFFPDRAARLQQGGVAVLKCDKGQGGRLSGCVVLAEGPTTFSFGSAALKMAATGYLRAKEPVGGSPITGPVRIVVMFPTPSRR